MSEKGNLDKVLVPANDGGASPVPRRLRSIDDLLASRGVHKNDRFDDYQDYLEQRQRVVRPKLFRRRGISSTGSMHLALGRVISVKDFKY